VRLIKKHGERHGLGASADRLYDPGRMALIGDGDRERAAAQLTRHYLRGRLSLDELGDRLEVALSARRDTDIHTAFSDLPVPWREQAATARQALDVGWREARRLALAVALWSLWWLASVVLLVAFLASALAGRLSWTNTAVVVVLWLASAVAVKTVTRRRPARRR
jgi:hypothetical protein